MSYHDGHDPGHEISFRLQVTAKARRLTFRRALVAAAGIGGLVSFCWCLVH